MPLEDLSNIHITEAQRIALNDAIDIMEPIVISFTQNLTPEERQRYGSINEQNKLFANKVYDYHVNNPELQSSDVDWVEFDKDYNDRRILESLILQLDSIRKMLFDAKIRHDSDNYKAALTDYDYTQYKSNAPGGGAWSVKNDELKQFFGPAS